MTPSHNTATALADVWGAEVGETDVLGHPCLSFVNRRRSLSDLLIDGRRFADRDYLVQGPRRLSFATHEVAVEQIAALLRERGIGPGDRVMIFGANAVEWVLIFWAIVRCGAVVVLGNAWWSRSELNHALDTVHPTLVVVDDVRDAALPAGLARLTFAEVASALESSVPVSPVPTPAGSEDDAVVVLFTSGTTGLPKGAVLSHRGIISTLQGLMVVTRRLPAADGRHPPESRSLLSIPLFHVGGLQQIITPMVGGGTLVFTEGRFDPARVTALIEAERIAVWSTVPTMVSRLIDHLESVGHLGLDSVRTVGMGGSPVGMQLRAKVSRWFPNVSRGLSVTYGLSEGGGVLTTGSGPELLNRPGAVGKPLKTVTLRIADPDGQGSGEILVRAPSVMLGYWPAGQPGTVADADTDSPISSDRWLRTGDIGWIDDDGYLYITDRSKDIVIRGGENIATPHVENRLAEHPLVREVAVVGLPHPELGEEVGAILTLDPNSAPNPVTEAELKAFAAEGLAYFEVPTKWWLRTEPMPQNATGKILKRELRAQWLQRLQQ